MTKRLSRQLGDALDRMRFPGPCRKIVQRHHDYTGRRLRMPDSQLTKAAVFGHQNAACRSRKRQCGIVRIAGADLMRSLYVEAARAQALDDEAGYAFVGEKPCHALLGGDYAFVSQVIGRVRLRRENIGLSELRIVA